MHPPLPPRPMLRPGVRVVRRDSRHLQVGALPDARLVLPDCPAARDLLEDLSRGRAPRIDDARQRQWLDDLVVRALVVDADLLGTDLSGPAGRAAVAAAYAQLGPDAHTCLVARARATVAIDAPAPWGPVLADLLEAAGVRVVGAAGRRTADLVVVVEPGGEVSRRGLEEWVRTDRAHLVVSNLAARVEVGPLVVPGLTACVGCVDAHRADRDPGRGLVVQQHEHRDAEPCDDVLMGLGLAWAARDAVSFLEGGTPGTWSASVIVDASLALPRTEWTRHPRCGCSWGDALAAG